MPFIIIEIWLFNAPGNTFTSCVNNEKQPCLVFGLLSFNNFCNNYWNNLCLK
jgi:hypothetical protein